MTLVWTKSTSPLSVLIRWVFKEPTSHFGIVFDNGIIFHSNLLGTHVEWYKTFTKKNSIVFKKEFNMCLNEEEKIFQSLLNTYDDKTYDFKAFLYFSYRALLFKLFNIAIPLKNKWNNKDNFLCTELAGVLPDNLLNNSIKNIDLSIITPYQLYLKME